MKVLADGKPHGVVELEILVGRFIPSGIAERQYFTSRYAGGSRSGRRIGSLNPKVKDPLYRISLGRQHSIENVLHYFRRVGLAVRLSKRQGARSAIWQWTGKPLNRTRNRGGKRMSLSKIEVNKAKDTEA